jgi:hypothetical protein
MAVMASSVRRQGVKADIAPLPLAAISIADRHCNSLQEFAEVIASCQSISLKGFAVFSLRKVRTQWRKEATCGAIPLKTQSPRRLTCDFLG